MFIIGLQVRRVALEQLVMRTKALHMQGYAAEICAELPEPPEKSAVETSVRSWIVLYFIELVSPRLNRSWGQPPNFHPLHESRKPHKSPTTNLGP